MAFTWVFLFLAFSKERFQKGMAPLQLYWNNYTIQGNKALNVF